jgi:sporulation protein YlmC with PRC-barrel domain
MRTIELRALLGKKVFDSEGQPLGHLEEIEAERGDEYCVVNSYLVEHRGVLDRISSWALTASMREKLERRASARPYRVAWNQMDLSDPDHPRTLVPKDALERAQ